MGPEDRPHLLLEETRPVRRPGTIPEGGRSQHGDEEGPERAGERPGDHRHPSGFGAIGSRALQSDLVRRRQPLYRVALGKTGNLLVRLFAVPGIRDTQCGFKLFRGDLARELFGQAKIDRFAYDMEILFLARRKGIAIAEVPVLWFNSPDSRVSVARDAVVTLRDLLRIRWIHRES